MAKSSSFCTNCGISLKSTVKFCGSCGTAREQIEDTTVRSSSKKRASRPRKKSREEELAKYEEEYLSRSKGTNLNQKLIQNKIVIMILLGVAEVWKDLEDGRVTQPHLS